MIGLSDDKPLDDDRQQALANEAKIIYSGGYRQEYSDILTYVKIIGQSQPSGTTITGEMDIEKCESAAIEIADPLDTLTHNLTKLRDYVRENQKHYGTETFYGLYKLKDHVAIEIQRYRDQQNLERRLIVSRDNLDIMTAQVSEILKDLEKAKKTTEDAVKKINVVQRKSDRLQMETVAILGIFAAIVMTFTGGLSLIGDAMTAVAEVPIFESVFVVILCAIVVLNIIVFLILAIQRIMNGRGRPYRRGNIFQRGWSAALDNGAAVTLNIIFIALLGIDGALWFFIG